MYACRYLRKCVHTCAQPCAGVPALHVCQPACPPTTTARCVGLRLTPCPLHTPSGVWYELIDEESGYSSDYP